MRQMRTAILLSLSLAFTIGHALPLSQTDSSTDAASLEALEPPRFEVETLFAGDHSKGGYFWQLIADNSDREVLYTTDSPKHVIRRLDIISGTLEIYSGTLGKVGLKNGPREKALFSTPKGLCQDPSGNLFVVDSGNAVIRRIDAETGYVSTVAGTPGLPGYIDGGGDDSKFTREISQLVCRADGSVVVGDTGSSTVRRVVCVANCGKGGGGGDDPVEPPAPSGGGDDDGPAGAGPFGLGVWPMFGLGALAGFVVGVVAVAALLIFGSPKVLREVVRHANEAHEGEAGTSSDPLLGGGQGGLEPPFVRVQ